jgi:integrase
MAQQDSRTLVPVKNNPGIYQRGNSYVVRWKHRGQSHKRYFTKFAEAREFKRGLHGTAKQPTTKQTVADYFEGWITTYRGRTSRGLEETTREGYRHSFTAHVLPFPLARERLRDVTSRDVSDWFTELERKNVKPPSIRKAKAALSAMLATAAQAGDIPANPVIGVRYVPTNAQPKRKRRTLTVEDVDSILRKLPSEWRLFFELLAQSGCRVGELLGLTWGRVHLGDDPHLDIAEQVYRGQRKRLKTEGSERTVPLSPGMARALTDWKARTDHADQDSPVFASSVGTPLGYPNVYNRVLRPALKACGLDGQGIAFHAFRKACGSMLLLRAGKDPRQVQRWLGHSQLTTTMNIYVHELDDGLGGADDLDGLWGHPGATEHPQTAANGTDPDSEIPPSDAVSADSREPLT